MTVNELLRDDSFTRFINRVYGGGEAVFNEQKHRYEKLAERFRESFGDQEDIFFFSAPGRTEIGGNHTDHNNGKVLAAAVNLDTVACVSKRSDDLILVESEGYPRISVDLKDLMIRAKDYGTTRSIIRGTAALLKKMGMKIGGFNAAVTSSVLRGSGLSSSAAFEVLMIAILDGLYNQFDMDPIKRASLAQEVENIYFGKPCGLMDQMACSVGGMVAIDFAGGNAVVTKVNYDFKEKGYALCVVNTGGNHGDLTDDYAAIRLEMEKVAAYFGANVLREVESDRFETAISEVRQTTGDRAVLRAMHFFDENLRVEEQVNAIRKDDMSLFFRLVNLSGDSSWKLLQNVYARPGEEQMALAIEATRRFLKGKGAQRVHGGGFAGTIQAYVPLKILADYIDYMEKIFGRGCWTPLDIRSFGAVMIGKE